MKPAPFEYHCARTTEEVLELLSRHGGEARLLAGGQSLIPAMNFRLARPAVLIDLNRIGDLDYILEEASGGVRIGAMTRQRSAELSPLVRDCAPLLHEALPWIAHPQIRNRGTIGGSLAHADPAAELPAVMLALRARLRLESDEDERWLSAGDFFTGLFETARRDDELLTEAVVPHLPSFSGVGFEEFARRHGDYALAGAAAVIALEESGECREARLAFFSVGDGPVEAGRAAHLLKGSDLGEEAIREAARVASGEEIDPPGDIHASPEYRRHLANVLAGRVLRKAASAARRELESSDRE